MIEILTIGDWDIRSDGESVLDLKGYYPKTAKLFQYFLVHKNNKVTPEKIIEDTLNDIDYSNPKNVLRTQVSRLRSKFGDKTFYNIDHIGGYYRFELTKDCTIDFQDFQNLLKEGSLLMHTDRDKSKELFDQAVRLYRGEFLPNVNDDWVIPVRSRFDRLYIEGLYNYLEILKEEKDYHRMVETIEYAIRYKPYEEMLSIYFIDALININQRGYALKHYNYFIARLYKDLKMKPSNHMDEIYNKILDPNSYFNK